MNATRRLSLAYRPSCNALAALSSNERRSARSASSPERGRAGRHGGGSRLAGFAGDAAPRRRVLGAVVGQLYTAATAATSTAPTKARIGATYDVAVDAAAVAPPKTTRTMISVGVVIGSADVAVSNQWAAGRAVPVASDATGREIARSQGKSWLDRAITYDDQRDNRGAFEDSAQRGASAAISGAQNWVR